MMRNTDDDEPILQDMTRVEYIAEARQEAIGDNWRAEVFGDEYAEDLAFGEIH